MHMSDEDGGTAVTTTPPKTAAGPLADDIAAYRAQLRPFLATPALNPWRHVYYRDVATEMRSVAGLLRVLHDAGFGRYGYPVEAGGLGGDVRHCAVLYDELAAADLPITGQHGLLTTLGPAIIRFAPGLAGRYLPSFLRGDEWWSQGFSEPEAGSDLASLRCRAVRDGADYVVTGQKLWTSHGETAARMVLLVRTGTPESRHRGLSMLLVDTDTPGVSIRPVLLASGRAELSETFFDDVRVPVSRLIGEEGQGWAVSAYLLQFERAVFAWQRAAVLLARLRTLAGRAAGMPLAQPLLARAYLDVVAIRARSATTVRRLAADETVGPEASADKLLLGIAEQSLYDAARTLLGSEFALAGGEDTTRWRDEWWYSRTTTIYGGSAEIQREILADRVLGLPKK
jgi:alkylation response protein AidB-like acyl-CoA dehydrogenase